MTAGVTILNYTVAHDSGNVITLIVDGQVQAGSPTASATRCSNA